MSPGKLACCSSCIHASEHRLCQGCLLPSRIAHTFCGLQRVQLQEDTIKNLQAELAGRSQPAAAMQALANPLVSDDSPSAEPPADAHAHVHQAAQPGFGGLRASPKRDRPLQQTDADDDCARRARRAPRDRGLGFLPGMKLSNQAE